MSDRHTQTTAWWLWPALAIINPFTFLWLYAVAQVWAAGGWHAVVEGIANG